MEQLPGIRRASENLSLLCDKMTAMGGHLDDLLTRAIRIANAVKNNMKISDTMFPLDLQGFRNDIKAFNTEIVNLPNMIGSIERSAHYEEAAIEEMRALQRLIERLHNTVQSLYDRAHLAHQYIRQTDFKIEAWYLVQDMEQMVDRTRGLPTMGNRILMRVLSPEEKG